MMTRGRAHPLTVEEPAITVTVAGTYLLDSQPAATMIDSSATHSFVSRYSFFCFSHIYSFVARTFINRLGRCAGKLARPMVTKVADNRMIYVTDVYRVTLEFPEFEFLLILFFPIFFPFWNYDVYASAGFEYGRLFYLRCSLICYSKLLKFKGVYCSTLKYFVSKR